MLPAPPLTIEDLAERWRCSAQTVRDLIKRGELRAFRLGSVFRITEQAVLDYEATAMGPEAASIEVGLPGAFNPNSLAERWQCSAQAVRDLIASGRLEAFRVGRFFRISKQIVLAFEARREAPSARRAEESISLLGAEPGDAEVILIRHARPRRKQAVGGTSGA